MEFSALVQRLDLQAYLPLFVSGFGAYLGNLGSIPSYLVFWYANCLELRYQPFGF
jgi:hypothetical protein